MKSISILLILKLILLTHGSKYSSNVQNYYDDYDNGYDNGYDMQEAMMNSMKDAEKKLSETESSEWGEESFPQEESKSITDESIYPEMLSDEENKTDAAKHYNEDERVMQKVLLESMEDDLWKCEHCTFLNKESDKICKMCNNFRNPEDAYQAVNKNVFSMIGGEYDTKHVNFVKKSICMKDKNPFERIAYLDDSKYNDVRRRYPSKFMREEFNFLVSNSDGTVSASPFTSRYIRLKPLDKSDFENKREISKFEEIPAIAKRIIANYLCLKEQFDLARTSKKMLRESNHGEHVEARTEMLQIHNYRVTFNTDKLDRIAIEIKTDGQNIRDTLDQPIDPERNCLFEKIEIGKVRFVLPSTSGWHEYTMEGWLNDFPNFGLQFTTPDESVEQITRRIERMNGSAKFQLYNPNFGMFTTTRESKTQVKHLENYTGPASFEASGATQTGLQVILRLYKRTEPTMKK
jgi:hypothetical protein